MSSPLRACSDGVQRHQGRSTLAGIGHPFKQLVDHSRGPPKRRFREALRHIGARGSTGLNLPPTRRKEDKPQSPLTCATASAAQAPTTASGSAPTRSRWVGRCPEQRFRRYLGRVGPPEDRSRCRSSPVQARPAAIFEVMLTSSSVGLLQWTLGFRGGSHIAPSFRESFEGLP